MASSWSSLPPMELLVGGRYQILRQIVSSGPHATENVYVGRSLASGTVVAIKVESTNKTNRKLKSEAKIHRLLTNTPGFPAFRWYGAAGSDKNVLVTDFLGPSLEYLLAQCGGRFQLKTVVLIADQLLSRLESFHAKHMVHCNIHPSNFVVGLSLAASHVHMIDFGGAQRYRDSMTFRHVPYEQGKRVRGAFRFMSINVHLGIKLSRRDDLESLGYMLIFLLKGHLPWQGLHGERKVERILERKLNLPLPVLCSGCAPEFRAFLDYARALRFDETPDYAYLKGLFRQVYVRQSLFGDERFDWMDGRDIPWPPQNNQAAQPLQTTPSQEFDDRIGQGVGMHQVESALFGHVEDDEMKLPSPGSDTKSDRWSVRGSDIDDTTQ
ncbi:Aste57867_23627 [Aphanomyces stellatus]|uniref:Casein kinase I n=1 Tax=Aphanomyces stellatus TaxID=120398 RepID=A0A485LPA5_9STRA|nr:hypothetical protein As57867_023555 [Aphanomyces stellatus]VFU00272.1 Aste57867_23627 [Aphanomyces stellatus]